ncbi:hypothetical protein FA95DRAFT_1566335 [Auriscalpium vulgare]|uniref:Uncharacterized protein n=1 Tax=Auriscalpium vulgare TaxID=40419 RepID=A0ACB8R8S9_9AGAM|nr:hypothetical protein FA95DRAFT_1566335 [Auriscalpium vulgare]
MPELPIEIRTLIAHEVSSADDLRQLRAVDRHFCAVASPAAFRIARATNRIESARRLVSLLESNLSQHVREVVYRDSAVEEDGKAIDIEDSDNDTQPAAPYYGSDSEDDEDDYTRGLDPYYGPEIVEPLVRAFALAAELPGLTSLCFTFHTKHPHTFSRCGNAQYNDIPPKCDPLPLHDELLKTIGAAAPHLRSLTLVNLTPIALKVYESREFHAALSSLSHLRISVAPSVRSPHAHLYMYCHWRDTVNKSILPHLKNVVSLTLGTSVLEADCPIAWKRVSFPRLKRLSLEIDVASSIMDDEAREEFVSRHSRLEWIDVLGWKSRDECVRIRKYQSSDSPDNGAHEGTEAVTYLQNMDVQHSF